MTTTKRIWTVAACATLLWTGAALAATTAQQRCNDARITAWRKYQYCVDAVVAKDAKVGNTFDTFAAFAKCRHKYFIKWTGFQTTGSLAGSTCIGTRYTDNGDGSVTDNLSELVWEKKYGLDSVPNYLVANDADNLYTWNTGGQKEDGTVFTSFLPTLNGASFAGANGWRLPTLAELQTTVLDFACTGAGNSPTCICPALPCVDSALNPADTQYLHFSSTSYLPAPTLTWVVTYGDGNVGASGKIFNYYARAVRGGL